MKKKHGSSESTPLSWEISVWTSKRTRSGHRDARYSSTKASLHFTQFTFPLYILYKRDPKFILFNRCSYMFMFYRKTTLVCARVYKNFTDGGCGCGCGANRRGASVSIGPNHSTYLCPLPSFFLQYSSQRRTTLLSYPTLSYPVLSCTMETITHTS